MPLNHRICLRAIERAKGKVPIEVTRQPNDLFVSKPNLCLAIDPHLRSMACAWIDYASEKIVAVETWKYVDKKAHWPVVAQGWWAIPSFAKPNSFMSAVTDIVIEFPDHIKPHGPSWSSLDLSSGIWSKKAGASNKQVSDLCKVALSIGYLSAGLKQSTGIQPVLVEPREWKGSKSKTQTEGEILPVTKAFLKGKKKALTEHELDSVAIGTWYVKKYKFDLTLKEAKDG